MGLLRVSKKIPVFVSYAHADDASLDMLAKQLVVNEYIEIWTDNKILAGVKWNKDIIRNIRDARIILFLLSDNFFNSEYISEVEVKHALRNPFCSKIGVILKPVDFSKCFLSAHQALPKRAKAISTFSDPQQGWNEVIVGIFQLTAYLLSKENNTPFTDKVVLAVIMLLCVTGLAIIGYGVYLSGSFYLAAGALCVFLGLGSYLTLRKIRG